MDVFETDKAITVKRWPENPLARLLRTLNQYMTAQEFREAMTMQLCFYGNAYALVERNSVGDVISLIPLMSANMDVRLEGKRLFIAISVTMNTPISRTTGNFPFKGLVLMAWWGCLRLHACKSAGVAVAMEDQQREFYANGAKSQNFNHGDQSADKRAARATGGKLQRMPAVR
jgi:hypothetical protein